jgi:hypothetical protein
MPIDFMQPKETTMKMSQCFALACGILLATAALSPAAIVPVANADFNDNSDANLSNIDDWNEVDENQTTSMAQLDNAFGKTSGDLVARLGFKFDSVSLRQNLGTTYGSSGYVKYILSVDALATTDVDGMTPVASGTTQGFQMIFNAGGGPTNIKLVAPEATDTWQTFTLELTLAEVLSASAGADNIELRFFKAADTANFVVLDNVQLTQVVAAVPAPAGLPAGLALLTLVTMRYRRK